MLYIITSNKKRAYYEKKLRRLGRWVDRYEKPFFFYNSYPFNDRVLDEWCLINQSLKTRNSCL